MKLLKNKLFFGYTVILITLITAITGCAGTQTSKDPEFPKDFIGTWERVDQTISKHILDITSTTIKASNEISFWNISLISGDTYTITNSNNPGLTGTMSIKLSGRNLEIIDAYDMVNISLWSGTEDDWTGTWKKR